MGTQIPPTIEVALLYIGIEALPPQYKILTLHILLAAKLNITRNWRQVTALLISSIIADVNY